MCVYDGAVSASDDSFNRFGPLVLIGLRASGKSTLGVQLAARTGRAFLDLDERTRLDLGAHTVREAFEERGQAAFRAAEARALRAVIGEVNRGSPGIIALGGGTPTAPGAEALLRAWQREGATLVYLRAPAAVLAKRLRAALGDRPSLTGADPIDEIEAVLAQRDALYMALADAVVDASVNRDEAVDAVLRAWCSCNSGGD